MRQEQKEEILDFIKSLYQAHEEIRQALNLEKTAAVQNMLVECQEFAAVLGNTIEKSEGEGHPAVLHIEEYCEMLFCIYGDIGNGRGDIDRISKMLEKSIREIENCVKNGIRARKEIVFFPYKSSMWDSLESIYAAAKEDGDCDAYCVPIPYYDLNPDHSFGQMHYEGGEYPQDIEVVDWQAYRFEERRPDEIYIHNAYDDWNLVTSVHPRFYSGNLRRYTKKLIYVPYFVLGKIDPEDTKAVDKIKHFCFLPGIIYADHVIVESEEVKKIYIEEFLKEAKAGGLEGRHLERRYLEHKILGLGSPKYDKIASIRREDIKIPDKWHKIIFGPEGSRKKVILYNTSIAALLQHKERALGKIEDVFRVFKGNRDKAVLLWRPHPLLGSTITSMCPQLWHAYERLVKGYVGEGWGIYDDTADFDRAIGISDAYYGDSGSVVQVYKRTGKPAMLQRIPQYEAEDASCMPRASAENVFYEGYGMELAEFIDSVTGRTLWEKKADTKIKLCGPEIHRELKMESTTPLQATGH